MIIQWPQSWKRRNPRWYEDWSRWFAWIPVRLDDDRIAWLEMLEQKDVSGPNSDYIEWSYRRTGGRI